MNQQDLNQISARGISEQQIEHQLEQIKNGFPFLKLEGAAAIGKGIMAPTAQEVENYEKAWNDARPSFDAVVDTTSLTAGELKQRIAMLTDEQGPTILFESFGYQYGLPLDADVILDCRAVKNPYWIKELRSQSGLDEPVREYIEKDPLAEKFMAMALEVASVSFDSALKEGRNLVVFALGCSGGQHRSVYFASRLAREFKRGRSRSFHREEKRHGHYGS